MPPGLYSYITQLDSLSLPQIHVQYFKLFHAFSLKNSQNSASFKRGGV